MEIIGLILGIGLGIFSGLVPGMHLATLLGFSLALSAFLPATTMIVMVAAGAGTVTYMKHLSQTFHPTAQSQMALAHPGTRLAYSGRGHDVLNIMALSTKWAIMTAIPLGVFLLIMSQAGLRLGRLPAWLVVGIILLWIVLTAKGSKHPVLTLVGLLASGLFGYAALHHPAVRGSEHALSPLLAGLFAMPIAGMVFWESFSHVPHPFPAQKPVRPQALPDFLGIGGCAIGALSGFLAGLGAGSVIASLSDLAEDDYQYVFFHEAAEATNDLVAIGLAVAVGLGRSGEAAVLNHLIPQSSFSLGVLVLLALGLGLHVGKRVVKRLAPAYIKLVTLVDPRMFAGFVLVIAVASSWMAAGLLGLAIALSGCCIALFLRMSHLPAQTGLACLALPVAAFHAGLVPFLNGLLY